MSGPSRPPSTIAFALALLATAFASANARSSTLAAPASPKVFSVTRFGATGDGHTDDAAAIQRALDAAVAAQGGTVTFPCGEFRLASIPGQTPASHAPAGRSLLYAKDAVNLDVRGQGSCSHLFTTLPEKTVLELDHAQNVSVSALRITALNAKYVETFGFDGGSAIRFTGVEHGRIDHVEVDGASAGALYFTAGTAHSRMTANNVHDTYGAGIWEDDCSARSATTCAPSSPPNANVYDGNHLTNTGLAMATAMAVDDGNGTTHTLVQHNTIVFTRPPVAGNDRVFCLQVDNVSAVDVLDNTCTGAPYDGIAVTTGGHTKVDGIRISGNVITSAGTGPSGGSGIVVYDDPTGSGIAHVVIAHNHLSQIADDGIRLYESGHPGALHDCAIVDNTIDRVDRRRPGSHYGIDVEYSAQITVQGNTLTGDGRSMAAAVNINASPHTDVTESSNHATGYLARALIVRLPPPVPAK